MKSKVLLSTLLGGALLVGCTADDALEAGKVANRVNPDAPVFTVSLGGDEDGYMRAIMDPDDGMLWESIDKMSLYHGGGQIGEDGDAEKNGDDFFGAETEIRKFQAIYTQYGEGREAVFATQSMVNEGLAIMVFPADTAYTQDGNNPKISMNLENQTEADAKLTPFVSEVLNITKHGDLDNEDVDNSHSGGFGRQYDIALRRIGGQMRLKLDAENGDKLEALGDEIDPIDYRKVTITTDGEYKPFTSEMEIKVGQERGQLQQNGTYTSSIVGNNVDGHKYWKYSPWIEPTSDGLNSEISTTYFQNYDNVPTATFTLLPPDDNSEMFAADGTPNYGDVTIEVVTTYGTITITDDEEDEDVKLWSLRYGTDATTINKGLGEALQKFFVVQGETNQKYKGQLIAGGGSRTLKVDLSALNMNELHIKTAKQLRDAITVYNTLFGDAEESVVTFYLDGDEKGNFEMDADTWNAVLARLAINTQKNNVTFTPCTGIENEECTAIVLNSENKAAEVPALQFGGDGVELHLKGTGWTYTGTEASKKSKDIQGVTEIHVLDGAVLTPKNYISVVGDNGDATGIKLIVDQGGKVEVTSQVIVKINMTNLGTINITTAGKLIVDKDGKNTPVELVNDAQAQEEDEDDWVTGLTRHCGFITNAGELSVKGEGKEGDGKISNYGRIEITNDAVTAITNNDNSGEGFGSAYADDNKIGTVVLSSVDGGGAFKLYNKNQPGFVQYTIDVAEPKIADFKGTVGDCIANYIILGSKCTTLRRAGSGDKSTHLPDAGTIKYIEIQGKVRFDGKYSLTGLIIPAGGELTILNTASETELEVTDGVYNIGNITALGALTSESGKAEEVNLETYYGDATGLITGSGYVAGN